MTVRLAREKTRFFQHGGYFHRLLAVAVPASVVALLSFGGAAAAAVSDPAPLGLTAVGQAGSFFDVTIAPGTTLTLDVNRTNPGSRAVTARSYAGSVFTIVNGGFGATASGASATGATRWVNYPEEVFLLAPKTTSTKSFTVTVPAGTAPGEYISSIVLQDSAVTAGSGPVALARVLRQAIAISIRVPGALTPGFSLGAVSHSSVAGNSVVSVDLTNQGNQHLRPAGTLTIRDASQRIVSQAPLTLGTVYAGMSSTVAVTLNGALLPGGYTVTLALTDPETGAAARITNVPFTIAAPVEESPPNIVEVISNIIDAIVNPEPEPEPEPTAEPAVEPSLEPIVEPTSSDPEVQVETPSDTVSPTPEPEPLLTLTPLGEEPAAAASMEFSCGVGDALSSCEADATGLSLLPGSSVTVTAHSTPQVILQATVAEDGAWSGHAQLPVNLEPGAHFVVLDYTAADGTPGTLAGALILDDSLIVANLSEPAAVAEFNEATAAALERAAEVNAPIYDVLAHPVTTAAVAVAGVSLLGIVGVGGAGAPSGGASGGGSSSSSGGGPRGGAGAKDGDGSTDEDAEAEGGDDPDEVDEARTRKLNKSSVVSAAWGDRSRTWKAPGTRTADALSRVLPRMLSKHSSILQRLLLDGVWARAMFGSMSIILLILGPALVVAEFIVSNRNGILPAWPVLLIIILLGVLDSLSGLLSFAAITAIAVTTGAIQSLPDVRTLLGLLIVLATLPLVSQAFRPIRRAITSRRDLSERIFDYLLPPIFLGYAAASMLKAVNGLSGLELITPEDLAMVRWAVGLTVLVRIALEDVAAIAYPERSLAVQPLGLGESTKPAALIASAVGIGMFMFVTGAYFGMTTITLAAVVIFAFPMVARIWQDKLPNSSALYRILPRGFVKYVILLIVGIVLAKLVLGSSPTADTIATGFLILMVPSLVTGLAEMFARSGASFTKAWLPLSVTGASFVLGAGIVLGFIVIG
jgi:hypothetical protein